MGSVLPRAVRLPTATVIVIAGAVIAGCTVLGGDGSPAPGPPGPAPAKTPAG